MTGSFATPDVRELAALGLPKDPFPASSRQAYRIYFAPAIHQQIVAHAAEGVPVEICGVLVGKWGQDENGPFVSITECIRCEEAESKFAEVTFTHDSWAKINQEMDSRFSDLRIAGWYHSHPDFGIFLSDRDRFIQEHFFSSPGQVAFVVDPIRKTEGMFIWREAQPVPCEYYWIGNEIRPSMAEARTEKMPSKGRAEEGRDAPRPASEAGDTLYFVALRTLACMAIFLLGYYVALQQTRGETAQVGGRLGVELGLRYGAMRTLETIDVDMRDVANQLQILAAAQPAVDATAASTPEDLTRKAEWTRAIARVKQNQQRIQLVRKDYGFSPEEMEAIRRHPIGEKEESVEKSSSSDDSKSKGEEKKPASAAGSASAAAKPTGAAGAKDKGAAGAAPAVKEKPVEQKTSATEGQTKP